MPHPHIQKTKNFGTRDNINSISITRNGRTRQININPIHFSIGLAFVFALMIGYFASTAYMVFRDDLIGAQFAREARVKHKYEDRIATLRTKLDLVTSKQLLDQQAIENKVAILMERQQAIGSRGGNLDQMFKKAKKRGLLNNKTTAVAIPTPAPKQRQTSENVQVLGKKEKQNIDTLTTGSIIDPSAEQNPSLASLGGDGFQLRGSNSVFEDQPTQTLVEVASISNDLDMNEFHVTAHNQRLFSKVDEAIEQIDKKQRETISQLSVAAKKRSKKIAKVLSSLGVKVSKDTQNHIGGPYIPYEGNEQFDEQLADLNQSFEVLDKLSAKAKLIPVANPAPGKELSSRFGIRSDPFKRTRAMHSGLDFRAKTGDKIHATASGKVVHAGRRGGYGNLVEIKHANGYTTRYAHLSRILVKVGQKVSKGKTVGLAGSTGRSTGPHLHYEVRINGKAQNPLPYIRAGKKIRDIL